MEEAFTADRSHSASLFAALERARDISPRFDLIAVGLGPGSYAGIRIAIAAAIGLQLAMGSRLVGLASVAALESMPGEYLAIGDARRESCYFTHVVGGICVEGPLLMHAAELRAQLRARVGLPVFTCEKLDAFPDALVALPFASTLARSAIAEQGIIAEGDLEPIYLREPHITVPRR